MKIFFGYNIIVIDHDVNFGVKLSEALKFKGANSISAHTMNGARTFLQKFDYDVVLCNPHMPDGFVHQLIDWCSQNLETMPLFALLGQAEGLEDKILKKYAISAVLKKNDAAKIFEDLSKVLFNQDDFKTRLLEMHDEKGLIYELQFDDQKVIAKPLEVTHESIFITLNSSPKDNTLGILRLSAFDQKDPINYLMAGHLINIPQGGQEFKIHDNYMKVWSKVLHELEERQTQILSFLQKASGL